MSKSKKISLEHLSYVYIWIGEDINDNCDNTLHCIDKLVMNVVCILNQFSKEKDKELTLDLYIINSNRRVFDKIKDRINELKSVDPTKFKLTGKKSKSENVVNLQAIEVIEKYQQSNIIVKIFDIPFDDLVSENTTDNEHIKKLKEFINFGKRVKFPNSDEYGNIPLSMIADILRILYMYYLSKKLFSVEDTTSNTIKRAILYLDTDDIFISYKDWSRNLTYNGDTPPSIYKHPNNNNFFIIDLDINPLEKLEEILEIMSNNIQKPIKKWEYYTPITINTKLVLDEVVNITGPNIYKQESYGMVDKREFIYEQSTGSEYTSNMIKIIDKINEYRRNLKESLEIRIKTYIILKDKIIKDNIKDIILEYISILFDIAKYVYKIELNKTYLDIHILKKIEYIIETSGKYISLLFLYPIIYKYIQLFNNVFVKSYENTTGYASFYREFIPYLLSINKKILEILPINDGVDLSQSVISPYFPCASITDSSFHNESGFIKEYTERSKPWINELKDCMKNFDELFGSREEKIFDMADLLTDTEVELLNEAIRKDAHMHLKMYISIILSMLKTQKQPYRQFIIKENPTVISKYIHNIPNTTNMGTFEYIPMATGGYKLYKLKLFN